MFCFKFLDIDRGHEEYLQGYLVQSFMIERSLKVVLDGQSSPLFCINAGVPQ